jgi:hypothetical protein
MLSDIPRKNIGRVKDVSAFLIDLNWQLSISKPSQIIDNMYQSSYLTASNFDDNRNKGEAYTSISNSIHRYLFKYILYSFLYISSQYPFPIFWCPYYMIFCIIMTCSFYPRLQNGVFKVRFS